LNREGREERKGRTNQKRSVIASEVFFSPIASREAVHEHL
jgi:hypothetical protein